MKFNTGERGGSCLKEGVYELRILKAEDKVAQSSGNQMINLQLTAVKNGRNFGPVIYDNIVFSEAAEWRFQQLMDSLQAPDNMDVDTAWLEGQTVFARLTIDDYQDDQRNKVARYMLPSAAQKIMAKEAGDNSDLVATDSGAKARGRGRPTKDQPAEFSDQEAMPI